ncbi:sys1 [Anaeramoeba ignava]|uniref:Sys1 n=1 Tax=Anaeramoeba ignava TaxID=1746090 RepID=A0A9Q0R698_ANAIG|nr:sys1 [Anaeramoeba ignava]KAJ5078884.1 sys1 [Anaeramoeba ignava]
MWYLFFVVAAFFLLVTFCCLRIEHKKKRPDILEISPTGTFFTIIILQIMFFIEFQFVLVGFDTFNYELFTYSQLWNAKEFQFRTARGLITTFSLIFSGLLHTIISTAILHNARKMADYGLTWFFIYFIIVSAVTKEFPDSGAWWVATLISLILMIFVSEQISLRFDSMSYLTAAALEEAQKQTSKTRRKTIKRKEKIKEEKEMKKIEDIPPPVENIEELSDETIKKNKELLDKLNQFAESDDKKDDKKSDKKKDKKDVSLSSNSD